MRLLGILLVSMSLFVIGCNEPIEETVPTVLPSEPTSGTTVDEHAGHDHAEGEHAEEGAAEGAAAAGEASTAEGEPAVTETTEETEAPAEGEAPATSEEESPGA